MHEQKAQLGVFLAMQQEVLAFCYLEEPGSLVLLLAPGTFKKSG